ncbi:hypothetical protein cyc_09564 [Cyclospora cayetanensis]|uniref:Uncharacterized protein n=1 Tax=Cyclospora cayetanensis TaxID=88456 RepID=A0A1D3D578_9EIME|nr:hypothetical protein cyc_09564 [Cyclospora cayetanensis]
MHVSNAAMPLLRVTPCLSSVVQQLLCELDSSPRRLPAETESGNTSQGEAAPSGSSREGEALEESASATEDTDSETERAQVSSPFRIHKRII